MASVAFKYLPQTAATTFAFFSFIGRRDKQSKFACMRSNWKTWKISLNGHPEVFVVEPPVGDLVLECLQRVVLHEGPHQGARAGWPHVQLCPPTVSTCVFAFFLSSYWYLARGESSARLGATMHGDWREVSKARVPLGGGGGAVWTGRTAANFYSSKIKNMLRKGW